MSLQSSTCKIHSLLMFSVVVDQKKNIQVELKAFFGLSYARGILGANQFTTKETGFFKTLI